VAPPNSYNRISVALTRPPCGALLAGQAEGLPQEELAALLAARRRQDEVQLRTLVEGRLVRALLAELSAQGRRLPELVAERLEAWRPFLIELALKVAERVGHAALDRGDYDLAPVVSQLLERARNSVAAREMVVLLHPADLDAVLGRLRRAGDEAVSDPAVRFETSPAVGRGSCQVRTEAGRLLFEPAEFLEQAAAIVREELAGDREQP